MPDGATFYTASGSGTDSGTDSSVDTNSQLDNESVMIIPRKVRRVKTEQFLRTSVSEVDEVFLRDFRARLRYHFMSPCQKYSIRKRKPVKLIIQVLKVFLVTMQLCMFSEYQFGYRDFIDGNVQSFRRLFLLEWDAAFDDPVQKITRPYALYTRQDFLNHTSHVVDTYFGLEKVALGNYSYLSNHSVPPIQVCKNQFNVTHIGEDNVHYLNPKAIRKCFEITHSYFEEDGKTFNISDWGEQSGFTLDWSLVSSIRFKFSLVNQHITSLKTYFKPVCYRFDITTVYDNTRHTGKLSVHQEVAYDAADCVGALYEYTSYQLQYMVFQCVLDTFITSIAVLSIVLCFRSIHRSWLMYRFTQKVWLKVHSKGLEPADETKFFQLWYFIIIIGDGCLVAGSMMKILITFLLIEEYTMCALLLGTSTLIVWVGILKYLNYFPNYNTLLLTLRKSMPNVLRFLVCCLFIYFGFAFAGWAVFGPFHYKFRTFTSTMETMYSLINGDDMFATFAEMRDESTLVYLFNQIWLYIFIGLFIYCVLSLFIGIISETYEELREMRSNGGGGKQTELEAFLNQVSDDPQSTDYHSLRNYDDLSSCLCCLPENLTDMVIRF